MLAALATDQSLVANVHYLAQLLAGRFAAGNKVLICGNGGSSCDAAHFAEELTGRFRGDRAPLPAIACTDVGHITCTANDFGFQHVFERWVRALGKPGDILILLSTSGHSPNMILAAHAGAQAGLHTVSLLGKDGGTLAGICSTQIIVPGETSDRIQELHMLILHALVEGVERIMFPSNYPAL
ncbi:MAG: SIS domain-containing protein [Pyrinomonadaceae bacterium]|nr:SIS domain-containing protein [Phycisphaerales bacterium]